MDRISCGDTSSGVVLLAGSLDCEMNAAFIARLPAMATNNTPKACAEIPIILDVFSFYEFPEKSNEIDNL